MDRGLGVFELDRPLARGGTAAVWSGRHRASGLPVALKTLFLRGDTSGTLERFWVEVRAAAALDHPHVLWIYDCGEVTPEEAAAGDLVAGQPWIAMEYADGGTLSQRAGTLDFAGVQTALLALLDALAHAHARGVIHRDLKPANVLFTGPEARLVLADFGMALTPVQLESSEAVVQGGTPSFMAPEQVRLAAAEQGPWTDLYAVGALAWWMLTGTSPFGHFETRQEVLAAHIHAPPPRLRPRMPVPHGTEAWLRDLLEKRPAHRIRRAADAAWTLARLTSRRHPRAHSLAQLIDLETGAPAVPVPPTWREASPPQRSHEHLTSGLALFGLRAQPVVGRFEERDLLWGALRAVAAETRPRGVSLRGAAGVGKSRLARWVLERADELGVGIGFRATHDQGGAAFHGLSGLVARALRAVGLRGDELWAHLQGLEDADEALRRAVFTFLDPRGAREAGRAVRFEGAAARWSVVERLIEHQAADRSALVWLDDVQWEPGALAFARHLLDSSLPVLVVWTAREEALARREATALDALQERDDVELVEVRALPEAHRAELVSSLLPLEPAIAGRLVGRTGGNPLFATQLVGDWVARGILVPTPAGFAPDADASLELPRDLAQLWQVRLGAVYRTDPTWRRPLELAAALGEEVHVGEWQRACRAIGIERPRGLVARLVTERLARLDADGHGRWAFAHGMLREAVLAAMAPADRRAVHGACGEALRGSDRAGLARAGEHLAQAGRASEAVDLLLAAEKLFETDDVPRAEELTARAHGLLEALGDPHDRRLAECWKLMAYHDLTRDAERSLALCTRQAEWARAHDTPDLLTTACHGLMRAHRFVGAEELARAAGAEGQRAAERTGDPGLLATTLLIRAKTVGWFGASEEKERLLLEALSIPHGLRPDLAGWAREELACTRIDAGELDEATELLEAVLADPVCTEHVRLAGAALNALGNVHLLRDDPWQALAVYREAAERYRRAGLYEPVITSNIAGCLLDLGRPDEAREALDALDVSGSPAAVFVVAGTSARASAALGDWARVREDLAAIQGAGSFQFPRVALHLTRTAELARRAGQVGLARMAEAVRVRGVH